MDLGFFNSYIITSVCIFPAVCSLQSAVYSLRFTLTVLQTPINVVPLKTYPMKYDNLIIFSLYHRWRVRAKRTLWKVVSFEQDIKFQE